MELIVPRNALNMLPNDCRNTILSLMSPKEACVFATVQCLLIGGLQPCLGTLLTFQLPRYFVKSGFSSPVLFKEGPLLPPLQFHLHWQWPNCNFFSHGLELVCFVLMIQCVFCETDHFIGENHWKNMLHDLVKIVDFRFLHPTWLTLPESRLVSFLYIKF